MSAERARRSVAVVAATTTAVVGALVLGGPPTSASSRTGPAVRASGSLLDLSPGTSDLTDGATARVRARSTDDGTIVTLHLHHLGRGQGRPTLGAHVHAGPCIEGSGAAVGPHWRTSPLAPASDLTEVWLDVTLTRGGTARSVADVPFHVPPGSAGSVVVHQLPTQPDGAAGPRLACLPVPF